MGSQTGLNGEHPLSADGLFGALPDPSAIIDPDGRLAVVNWQLLELTGYEEDELVGQSVNILVPSRLREVHTAVVGRLRSGESQPFVWTDDRMSLVRRDGTEVSVDFAIGPIWDGPTLWTLASVRENSLRRDAERARNLAEREFRLAFEFNQAPMVFTDADDVVTQVNESFCQMVGRTRDELIGRGCEPFTYPGDESITREAHERLINGAADQVRYVKRYRTADNRVLDVEVLKSVARDEDGRILYFFTSERDFTEERHLTQLLSYRALHDPLTGLANRTLFEDRLHHARSRIARHGGFGALLLIDLDDFKRVNDSFGHIVGDQLLREVARRLESVTRTTDTLCRFGGDEFLYLVEKVAGEDEVRPLVERLLHVMDEPFALGNHRLDQGASVGVRLVEGGAGRDADVIADADLALYEAKRLHKGGYVLFTADLAREPHRMSV